MRQTATGWCRREAWYSLNDYEYVYDPVTETSRGFNGNLVDHDSGQITPVGWRFAASAQPLMDLHSNAAIVAAAVDRRAHPRGAASVVTVTATLLNGGNLDGGRATAVTGDGCGRDVAGEVAARRHAGVTLRSGELGWRWYLMQPAEAGLYPLTAAVEMRNPQAEKGLEDNRVTLSLWLLRPGETLEQARVYRFEVVRSGG